MRERKDLAKLRLTTTEKLLTLMVLGLVVFAVGTQLTIVLNPIEVSYLDVWFTGSYTAGQVPTSGKINDITTATISGTVTAFRDFKPLSYIEDGVTYSFSRLYLSVYAKLTNGAYATTPTKEYTTTTYKAIAGGWYEAALPVDTTLIPNGEYKFVLTLAFVDSGGNDDGGDYFSVFYASFSTGSANGNNGGGDTEPAPAPLGDYTLIYVGAALFGLVVVYEIFLKKKR